MEEKQPRQLRFNYGGQAVIEGVMMRGAHSAAVAVRDPNGQIVVHETQLSRRLYRGRIIKTPFVRGVIGLWDALGLGTRALMWAADVAIGEDEESIDFNGPIGWTTVAFSLVLGIGLFFLLPTTAASGIGNLLGLETNGVTVTDINAFWVNLIEGGIRLALLVGYIWAIGRIPDVKRLFGYHGAEHKTINAYEAGAELKPEIVAQYPIEHPRCGTAFLLTVALVSVLVFSVLGRPPFLLLLLSRVLFIPVIAGISYEVIQFSAKHLDNSLVRTLIKPNLALQHLTTRQPELHMIEVAIVAFERVLVSEGILGEEEVVVPAPRPEAVSPTLAPSGD
ncbi:MAG: DUF1385 domain-containing protein [Anaerolineae bacterium]|nr:DUF1385 domain-containing protein [Anaerolineae bacterium]